MSIPSLLFALVVVQDHPTTQPAAAMPPAPKPYAQLETMQRMLQRQIEAHRGEILVAQEGAEPRGSGGAAGQRGGFDVGSPGGLPSSVADDFVANLYATPSVASSHAEYVPGLAAIFSLTVPVRTEWVAEEAKKSGETETPDAQANSADDEAWEELARGDANRWPPGMYTLEQTLNRSGQGGRGAVARRQQRFSAAAVDALQRTLLDTIWRFGHKLELNSGERIAVVVEVQPATNQRWMRSAATDGSGSFLFGALGGDAGGGVGSGGAANVPGGAGGLGGTVTDATGAPVNDARVVADTNGDGFPDVFWRDAFQAIPARSFRLVIQVSADDLNALRAGTLDRDDTAKRTRVQRFASPAGEVTPAPAPKTGGR